MKFKYCLKIFIKNNSYNNNIINGKLILKKKKIDIYILKKNYFKKIFKCNFLIIKIFNIKYFTYIKQVKYKFCNNEIEYFVIKEILDILLIKYNINNKKLINNRIIYINKNKFPRKINLILKFKKKILKDCDFNFKNFIIKKKKLFYYLTK